MKKILIVIGILIVCLSNNITASANEAIGEPNVVRSKTIDGRAVTTASNQTITGYTGGGLTASGIKPKIVHVAVRCKLPIRYPGDTRALDPVIPFGTSIYIINNQTVPTPTGNRTQFNVQDTGDTKHEKLNAGILTPYWLDVYVGEDTKANREFADKKIGTLTRTYQFFH